MPDPKKTASVLDTISRGAVSIGGYVAPFAGPVGAALAIAGAATGIAADIIRGGSTPVTRAQDPDALLDAIHAHWRAKRSTAAPPPASRPS